MVVMVTGQGLSLSVAQVKLERYARYALEVYITDGIRRDNNIDFVLEAVHTAMR